VQGRPRPLRPTAREEIARIAGEALRNAFRHAGARRIDVDIRYEARRLRVTVSDDGQGIDADVLREGGKAGHFGLSGMRERAELAGGRLTVSSGRQQGTEVVFTAPGASAYVRQPSPPSRLLRRLFRTDEVGR
jgi:signal transduction histidine kinase